MMLKSKKFIINCLNKIENLKYEKLFRNDYKYDYLLPIKYNWNKDKNWKRKCNFYSFNKKL